MNVNGYEIKPYANLTGADLEGANLTGANLTGANLTGAEGIKFLRELALVERLKMARCHTNNNQIIDRKLEVIINELEKLNGGGK